MRALRVTKDVAAAMKKFYFRAAFSDGFECAPRTLYVDAA
jgi:hypothetical protein